VGDNWLTVIPTDPHRQPGREAADRAAAVLSGMLPDDRARRGVRAVWHDTVELVDCGGNLERISCPRCGRGIAVDRWVEAVSQCYRGGFSTLLVAVPCCGAETSLNELVYDWPMGFARFRIEVARPDRGWLSDEELAAVSGALGHPLRQILVHL
jgi:hypothetical protein